MTSILQSLSKTVHLSLGLAILLFLGLHYFGDGFSFDALFWSWLFRYIHVIVAIMWIGLLWYFNGACQDGRKAQQLGYDATELIRIPCDKIL